jgi:hypothetical protein
MESKLIELAKQVGEKAHRTHSTDVAHIARWLANQNLDLSAHSSAMNWLAYDRPKTEHAVAWLAAQWFASGGSLREAD